MKHFVVFYDFGKLYLLWGDIYNQKGDEIMAREKYQNAVKLFESAEAYLFEKRGYYLYYLLVDMGQAYYDLSLFEADSDKSMQLAQKAYDYTEQALLIKAVYGVKADNLRKKIRERIPHLELSKE
jgi:tetratricopeptide (TPR) repeat protein